MLSLSTAACYGCSGVISPRAIRKGEGDRYLLTVNRKLAEWGRPTYIRLLPEMNGHWNPYSAFDEDGSGRGQIPQDGAVPQGLEAVGDHHQGRPAEDDQPQAEEEQDAAAEGRAGRATTAAEAPARAEGRRSSGSRRRRARPTSRATARARTGRAASTSTGSAPTSTASTRTSRGLNAFYKHYPRKPFVIGEWGPWDVDNPAFTRHLFHWVRSTTGRRWRSTTRASGLGTRTRSGITRRARRPCAASSRAGAGSAAHRTPPARRPRPQPRRPGRHPAAAIRARAAAVARLRNSSREARDGTGAGGGREHDPASAGPQEPDELRETDGEAGGSLRDDVIPIVASRPPPS